MKQVLIRGGGVAVEDVPAPTASPRSLLVRVEHSCVSVGTELSSVRMSGLPLYRRALKQPHHAKRVLEIAKNEGFARTYKRVRGMLAAGLPTGYSAAGVVVAVGDGGRGLPRRRPRRLRRRRDREPRRADRRPGQPRRPNPGRARHRRRLDGDARCDRAPGRAPRPADARRDRRRRRARHPRAARGPAPARERRPRDRHRSRPEPDREGARARAGARDRRGRGLPAARPRADRRLRRRRRPDHCRDRERRGRAPGDAGLPQEGPRRPRRRRRPPPPARRHVREGARLPDLDLVRPRPLRRRLRARGAATTRSATSAGRRTGTWRSTCACSPTAASRSKGLGQETYPVDEAGAAYEALGSSESKPLLVLLAYPERDDAAQRTTRLRTLAPKPGRIGVALVGAGGFAQGQHLPNLIKLREHYELRAVMSRTGANAKAVAARAEAGYATTDLDEVLADDAIDLVLISTRHDTHADLDAPLARGRQERLRREAAGARRGASSQPIEAFYADRHRRPAADDRLQPALLPAAARLGELLADRDVAARRQLPDERGLHPARPLGARPRRRRPQHRRGLPRLRPLRLPHRRRGDLRAGAGDRVREQALGGQRQLRRHDRLRRRLGLHAHLHRARPPRPSEGAARRLRRRPRALARRLQVALDRRRRLRLELDAPIQKGHVEELEALARALREGGPWPIPLEQQLQATRISFAVEAQLHGSPPHAR